MAQFLKEEVEKRIVLSALSVFAEKGYGAATMSEIAAGAEISTGNIYRYYETKEALFDHAVDDKFVRTFTALLHARVGALSGVNAPVRNFVDHPTTDDLPNNAEWLKASEELLRFTIDNRLRVIILFANGRSTGTRLADFFQKTVDDLVKFALTHIEKHHPQLEITPAFRQTLTHIYENLIITTARILSLHDSEPEIRAHTELFTRYHLAGLEALFTNDE